MADPVKSKSYLYSDNWIIAATQRRLTNRPERIFNKWMNDAKLAADQLTNLNLF